MIYSILLTLICKSTNKKPLLMCQLTTNHILIMLWVAGQPIKKFLCKQVYEILNHCIVLYCNTIQFPSLFSSSSCCFFSFSSSFCFFLSLFFCLFNFSYESMNDISHLTFFPSTLLCTLLQQSLGSSRYRSPQVTVFFFFFFLTRNLGSIS